MYGWEWRGRRPKQGDDYVPLQVCARLLSEELWFQCCAIGWVARGSESLSCTLANSLSLSSSLSLSLSLPLLLTPPPPPLPLFLSLIQLPVSPLDTIPCFLFSHAHVFFFFVLMTLSLGYSNCAQEGVRLLECDRAWPAFQVWRHCVVSTAFLIWRSTFS